MARPPPPDTPFTGTQLNPINYKSFVSGHQNYRESNLENMDYVALPKIEVSPCGDSLPRR